MLILLLIVLLIALLLLIVLLCLLLSSSLLLLLSVTSMCVIGYLLSEALDSLLDRQDAGQHEDDLLLLVVVVGVVVAVVVVVVAVAAVAVSRDQYGGERAEGRHPVGHQDDREDRRADDPEDLPEACLCTGR